MKTLYLLRHAKANVHGPHGRDHARGLEPRGVSDAQRMGKYMVSRGYRPDLVLCSDAIRTIVTLEHVLAVLDHTIPTLIERQLYLAPPATLLMRLRQVENDALSSPASVLLIGHNPGLEELASVLADHESSGADHKALGKMHAKYSTCGLAVLQFPFESWAAIAPATADLTEFVRPADFGPLS